MRRDTLTVRARYLLPVEGPPIEDGCLTMQGPRIGWLGPAAERSADLDLGNVAIAPGFVNAHTHLELAVRFPTIGLRMMGRTRSAGSGG